MNSFLNCLFHQKPMNISLLLLSNPMDSSNRLEFLSRVEKRLQQDHMTRLN